MTVITPAILRMRNHDLQSDGDGLYVDGIGVIAQYHRWSDMLYSHGLIYFLRDYLFKTIEDKVNEGVSSKELRDLVARLNALNSKISAYEEQQCQ